MELLCQPYLHRHAMRTVNVLKFQTLYSILQSNLNNSNTDDLFATAKLNSFSSPYEILAIAQESKYFGICSYFIMKLYVVCTY